MPPHENIFLPTQNILPRMAIILPPSLEDQAPMVADGLSPLENTQLSHGITFNDHQRQTRQPQISKLF